MRHFEERGKREYSVWERFKIENEIECDESRVYYALKPCSENEIEFGDFLDQTKQKIKNQIFSLLKTTPGILTSTQTRLLLAWTTLLMTGQTWTLANSNNYQTTSNNKDIANSK